VDWKELNEDTILNYEEAHTGNMARYERIMSRRLRDSISALTESFNKQAIELNKSLGRFTEASSKLSNKIFWLNLILVFLTFLLVSFGIPALIWQIKHW